ncbi:MAG: DUF2927 domain-containing protein [Flavobacteriaceae bacterium]|nr:DUF2927 domain-containing protein [Flavobacteriaceae bacterium]
MFEKKITPEQIKEIKEKFTKEEITYFYETVFFIDPEGRKEKSFVRSTRAEKWNKDIYIKAYGDLSIENCENLSETVAYLNTLKLPIKVFITDNENCNVRIYFGNKQYIEKMMGNLVIDKNAEGIGLSIVNSKSIIDSATIGIVSTEKTSIFNLYKSNRILEELTQALGIPGDSFSETNSLFYQGPKNYIYSKKLAPIDLKVLQLLYSNNIKAGLGINEFFEAFCDIIPDTELKAMDYEAFDHFVEDNKFSQKTIELFCRTAFAEANPFINEPHVQKWNNNISYMLKEIDNEDSHLVVNTLKYLSNYIDKPKISFNTRANNNVNLVFSYSKERNSIIQYRFESKDMLRHQLFYGIIIVNKKNQRVPNEKLREKIILRQLLIVLGISPVNLDKEKPGTCILGKIDDSDTLFSQYDKELIQMFFSETLKSGMTKTKVLEIIKKHYPIDNFLKENQKNIANQSQSKKDYIKK